MEKHGSAQNYIGQKFGCKLEKDQRAIIEIIPGVSISNFLGLEQSSFTLSVTHSGFVFVTTGSILVYLDYKILGNFPIYQVYSDCSPYFMIINYQGDSNFFPVNVHEHEGEIEIAVIYTFRDSIVFHSDSNVPFQPTPLNGLDSFLFFPFTKGFDQAIKDLYLEVPERFAQVWSVAKNLGHSARIAKALGFAPKDLEISIRGNQIASFI